MRSPLESRIAALRGRVRRLLALHGTGRVVTAMVLAVVVAGLADWLIHLVPEVRLAALIGVVALAGWVALRHVLAPLVVRFEDLDIALRVERRWPGLNDRLSSTIQFLRARSHDESDYLGSRGLREATVARTLKEVESIDFRAVVEPRPARLAALAAAGALVLGLTLVGVAPTSSRLALQRLFVPFGGVEWPRQTELETPRFARKLAIGEPFTLEVAVRKGKRVPPSAHVTYLYDDGERSTEALRPDDRGVFRGRIDAVGRPFAFSVTAGDDRTGRFQVQVVPPPTLKDLTLALVPPTYTGLPRVVLAPGHTQVRAVEGTVVEIEATANKPLSSAVLHRGGSDVALGANLSPDGRRVSARLIVADAAPYWFSLKDAEPEHFANLDAARFEVRSVKDEAPRVTIEDPVGDREITANGVLPLRIAADDDFGLQVMRLVYKVAPAGSEPTKAEYVALWNAEGEKADRAAIRHHVDSRDWKMADLGPNLAPGTLISFHADASDLLPGPKGPNLGKSRELRVRIITREEAANRMEERRRDIRDEAERILAMQKSALTPVQEALRNLNRTDGLPQPARDALRNAEAVQRQVSGRVASPNESLDQKIRQFLDDLKNLKIENPDAQTQMQTLKAGVDRIKDGHLDQAEQGLSRGNKSLDQPDSPQAQAPDAANGQEKPEARAKAAADPKASPRADGKTDGSGKADNPPKEGRSPEAGATADGTKPQTGGKPDGADAKAQQPKTALARAETHQKAIADELQKMIDSLKEFDSIRGAVKEAEKLLQAQEQALKQSAEAAARPELAGKAAEKLDPQQKADVENLAARQAEIAKGLQGLEAKMDEMSKRMDEADPLAAAALRDAAAQSRQKGTSGKMAEGADKLAKNQMGSARTGQEQARQDLRELVDSLKNRREHELARLVQELKNAAGDMEKLQAKQARNLEKTKQARTNPDPKARKDELEKLAKAQAELQAELKKQLQRLKKLKADAAAKAGGKASDKMDKAKKDLDDDNEDEAEKDQEEILKDLAKAKDEIDRARKDAEEELAMEQLAKMADGLKALKARQDKVFEETAAYEKARAGREDKLTQGQRVSVRALARVQSNLKDETAALAARLEGAPVFALTLRKAVESMDVASKRLNTIKTDTDTQRAERSASQRFDQLLEALKLEKKDANGGGGGGGGGAKRPDGIPDAAQVKMLKLLQEELNTRTDELDELKARKKTLSEQQQSDLSRLEEDQGTIADLARDIARPKKDDGEE